MKSASTLTFMAPSLMDFFSLCFLLLFLLPLTFFLVGVALYSSRTEPATSELDAMGWTQSASKKMAALNPGETFQRTGKRRAEKRPGSPLE
jgi:hypothetical protein